VPDKLMKTFLRLLRQQRALCIVLICTQIFATSAEQIKAPAQNIRTKSLSTTITPMGGSMSLPKYAEANFPAKSFALNQLVTMVISATAETALDWSASIQIFGSVYRAPYEIRINTGAQRPLQPVVLHITVPANLMVKRPAVGQVKLFSQMFQDGDQEVLDNFEIFDTKRSGNVLTGTLPPEAFTNRRRADATYEAVLIVGMLGTKPKP
jgi:hypothetical protein